MLAFLLVAFTGFTGVKDNVPSYNQLLTNFQNPGNEAKPRVWYHWMNGNITKSGVEKDLLWMERSGIGGFHNFDAGLSVPQVVPERLIYMTPAWKEVFARMVFMADSLGLEVAVAASPGWSQSGGTWVKPEEGMKKLVWSETNATGNGSEQTIKLPDPPHTTGDFSNQGDRGRGGFSGTDVKKPEYYADVAVVAYPLGNHETMETLQPKVTSSGGTFTLAMLTDGDIANGGLLPYKGDEDPWIQYEFGKQVTIYSMQVSGGSTRGTWEPAAGRNDRALYCSQDGKTFRKVTDIPAGGVALTSASIPATTAKYFRLVYAHRESSGSASPQPARSYGRMEAQDGVKVNEWKLFTYAMADHSEDKAGFSALADLYKYQSLPCTEIVAGTSDVQVLTSSMSSDGTLVWKVPQGRWRILRIGYSLTGHQNSPASPEATGLEVDKLNKTFVKNYFDYYLGMYKDASGGLMGKRGLQYIMMDSYEAGNENWTPGLAEEFEKRRGYSLWPWMPALTGVVIGSVDQTEEFLWDWRKTLGEMVVDNYYGQTGDILHSMGMRRYTESHENGRVYQTDGMDVKHAADIPMSAMWVRDLGAMGGSTYEMAMADIRESASVAHIYGQKYVAAESMTVAGSEGTAYNFHPARLKYTADLEIASGLNRYVQHTSVHQPVDSLRPGESLSMFGQWLTRQETWADRADIWFKYLARGSYMMQQGRFVADIAYYYGEDNNITGLFGQKLPDIPYGYEYDFFSASALIDCLTVNKKGLLVTPSGMEYRVLVLDPNVKTMSTAVLRKIAYLARSGAIICGSRPERKADLAGSQEEWDAVAAEVWDRGMSNVSTKSLAEVLPSIRTAPDFSFEAKDPAATIHYVHRTLGEKGDIYWISNARKVWTRLTVTCRTAGHRPMLWHPEDGSVEEVSYKIHDGLTDVALNLSPEDAVLLVFMLPAKASEVVLPEKQTSEILRLEGAWSVKFQKGLGAPDTAVFPELTGWETNSDPGIRFFSGYATYLKKFRLSANQVKDGKIILDMGNVKNIAEVKINGNNVGTVWKEPFKLDVTSSLKEGDNIVEVKVWNQWVNRIIGDQQEGVARKYTYTVLKVYHAESPLQPSGLLGPVVLYSVQ